MPWKPKQWAAKTLKKQKNWGKVWWYLSIKAALNFLSMFQPSFSPYHRHLLSRGQIICLKKDFCEWLHRTSSTQFLTTHVKPDRHPPKSYRLSSCSTFKSQPDCWHANSLFRFLQSEAKWCCRRSVCSQYQCRLREIRWTQHMYSYLINLKGFWASCQLRWSMPR